MLKDSTIASAGHMVNVRRMCKNSQSFQGVLPLEACQRLASALPASEQMPKQAAVFDVSLRFWFDEKRMMRVEGHMTGEVALVCQRCLEYFAHKIDLSVALVYFDSEQQAQAAAEKDRLPEEVEVVIADSDGEHCTPAPADSVGSMAEPQETELDQGDPNERGRWVTLASLLEDDLLLGLPQVPKHPEAIDGGVGCSAEHSPILEKLGEEAPKESVRQNLQLAEGLAAIKAELDRKSKK